MDIRDERSSIWEQIDIAENYLVCCLFDEAASLSSSILKQLLINNQVSEFDMLESAGMVLVQSMKQLTRTSEILKDFKLLFGSLNLIPVQVFVTGVCFQLSDGLSTIAQGYLEEFVNSWTYVGDKYHPLLGEEARVADTGGSHYPFLITVDMYLEVVELYVVTLLATTLKDKNLAISWVEKAVLLPIEKRQVLLRRLQSMSSSITSSSQTSIYKPEFLKDQTPYNAHQKDNAPGFPTHEQNNTAKAEILKLSRNRVPYFSWFPTFSVKLGNVQLSIPSGKFLLASLLLIMFYITRKKQAMLKRFLVKHALSFRKAFLDLWQLAFSYQVNPLAAVQTLPNSTRGSR
ncbi:protein APEM9-like isoform X1 [Salvia splendens]|uniref:protein APEM9-like isoform X1 n=1 Tax=Salvia splendens TaxID=180675 RepID=UPI0010FFEDAB|nr:protein APEM9-like isoform X1 [Salvia splendens]XP_042031697.1 protein APEM9-like isoform X1 [Salvia splendens]